MLIALVQWLERIGPLVFWTCIVGALAVDTVAAATVIGTRSRELVNKWTGTIVVANALLLGVGTAVPAAMYVTRMAVMAVAPSVPSASLTFTEP
jgi:hypothetical protein